MQGDAIPANVPAQGSTAAALKAHRSPEDEALPTAQPRAGRDGEVKPSPGTKALLALTAQRCKWNAARLGSHIQALPRAGCQPPYQAPDAAPRASATARSTCRDVAPTAFKERVFIRCVTCTPSPEEQHLILLLAEQSNARLGEARDNPCSPVLA